MKLTDLPVGTRIFNGGDMANSEHFGTITAIKPAGRFSAQVEITPDEGSERGPYWVTPAAFSPEYKGHGGTRFVTENAYYAWRNSAIATMKGKPCN